jgi:uncharacterized protein
MKIKPLELIDKYYGNHSKARNILLAHSRQVADLAVSVADAIMSDTTVDRDFIEEAAMLHDIGMLYTNTPKLGCHGDKPYITHGVIGAELLLKESLPHHALVCERHIGVGLSIQDIEEQQLPLPSRDMRPQTLEEKIVAYADLFFSKTRHGMRTADMARNTLDKHGHYKAAIFDKWHKRFDPQT